MTHAAIRPTKGLIPKGYPMPTLDPDWLKTAGALVTGAVSTLGIGKLWEAWLHNKGQAHTRQADELSGFRKELREDIAKLEAKVERLQGDNDQLKEKVASVVSDLTQVLMSGWVFKEKVQMLIRMIRTNNPGLLELASDLERDENIPRNLLDKYNIPLPQLHIMPGQRTHACRILIADDVPDTLQMFRLMLINEPYEVVTVESGAETLHEYHRAKASGQPFDLLVLDQAMPNLTGEDVAKAIRQGGDTKTRIAFLTANRDTLEIGMAEINDVSAVWEKPIKAEQLIRNLRSVLQGIGCDMGD